MNRLEFGSVLSPSDLGGSRGATPAGRAPYDDLAGAAMLRRTSKSAGMGGPLRGDQATTLLAARRKSETEDRVDRQLRDFYRNILREPVPERFIALLDALEAQGR